MKGEEPTTSRRRPGGGPPRPKRGGRVPPSRARLWPAPNPSPTPPEPPITRAGPAFPPPGVLYAATSPRWEKPSVGNAADASHLDSHTLEISHKRSLKKDFRFAKSHRPECVWRLQFVSCFWRLVQQAFFR